jgi:SOS-response transcriptional repressor LexA
MIDLTERQHRCLSLIATSIEANGYPPTFRELQAPMGIGSLNGVGDHLRALERKGYLTRAYGTSRGIQLTDKARELLGSGVRTAEQERADVVAWLLSEHDRNIARAKTERSDMARILAEEHALCCVVLADEIANGAHLGAGSER